MLVRQHNDYTSRREIRSTVYKDLMLPEKLIACSVIETKL